jgi:hypothetical protein
LAEAAIFEKFGSDTRYEVRRAARDGIAFALEPDFDAFVAFYRRFSALKRMPVCADSVLRAHRPHLLVTKAVAGDELICMHSYLTDPHSGRAMLFTSSSLFRDYADAKRRSMVGRANRFLHFEAMCHFKRHGFILYDLGGYAVGTVDPALRSINDFKDGFGGELRRECTYTSLPLMMVRAARRMSVRSRSLRAERLL